MVETPLFLYVSLILPSLFAGTLIVEGGYKMLNNQNGMVSMVLGFVFIGISVIAYFFLR